MSWSKVRHMSGFAFSAGCAPRDKFLWTPCDDDEDDEDDDDDDDGDDDDVDDEVFPHRRWHGTGALPLRCLYLGAQRKLRGTSEIAAIIMRFMETMDTVKC